jgi:hypothetical protein
MFFLIIQGAVEEAQSNSQNIVQELDEGYDVCLIKAQH